MVDDGSRSRNVNNFARLSLFTKDFDTRGWSNLDQSRTMASNAAPATLLTEETAVKEPPGRARRRRLELRTSNLAAWDRNGDQSESSVALLGTLDGPLTS